MADKEVSIITDKQSAEKISILLFTAVCLFSFIPLFVSKISK